MRTLLSGALVVGALSCLNVTLLSVTSESAWNARPAWICISALAILCLWLVGIALQL
jgi:hypothetical protein